MNIEAAYLRWAILRQVPIALATAALFAILTLLAVTLFPAKFTATTRLLVEASSVSANARAVADAQTDAAHLQNIENRLMTQTRLANLSDGLGLNMSAEDLRDATVFDVVSGRGKATTLTISVSNADANLATFAANRLADEVLKENRAIRTERAEDALSFFRQEVADRKRILDAQFGKLLDFKGTHAGALPEDASRHIDQRTTLLAQLSATPDRPKLTSAQKQLISQISAARAVYSDQHPKVKLLKTKLEATGQNKALTWEKDPEIQKTLALIDAHLAAIPANELTLKALNRDHDLAEDQYAQAVTRLEAAAIEERIALRTTGNRLSIVERAGLPDMPAGPRQKVMLAGGLALALLMGAAVAAIRTRADPYLRRPKDLETGLGLRPYAVIPAMQLTSTDV